MGDSTSFGPFTFDYGSASLSRDGVPVGLGSRAAALLAVLVEAEGAVVDKDRLIEAGWPGLTVEEGNLSVQIANLRKAMGPRPDGQDWIATVPRVGYRLLKMPAPQAATRAAVFPSLAVLPFDNLSVDPEQEYFADGVVEDIITALSRFKDFAVIARNSSFVYKGRAVDIRQVAKDLGVRYVLEGSVRRAANKLRITAQLIDATSGSHLWAQHFDGTLDDVFNFQDRITESVVGVVGPQVRAAEIQRSRRERPDSVEAYDLYLQAVALHYRLTLSDNAEAQALMQRAIELEPTNALFLAMLASLMEYASAMGYPPLRANDKELCLDLIDRALAHAGDDAMVLGLCGISLVQYMKQYDRGLAVIDRAVQLNPNSVVVLLCAAVAKLHCGDLSESVAHSEQAIRLSPGDAGAHWALTAIAHAQMILGNYEAALTWAERSLAMNASFPATYWMLVAANAHLGRMNEARGHLASLLKLSPGVTVARIWAGQPQKDPARTKAILEGLSRAGLPSA
jgi:TolB-like protein